MIIIRKVRNEERYSVKNKHNPYILIYVSSREQAEGLRKHWEMETHMPTFMVKMETHADEIKSDIFESKG